MSTFNEVLDDTVSQYLKLERSDRRDLMNIEHSALLLVLQELRTWIAAHGDMQMPGPQDRFAESIQWDTHAFLSYGATTWYVHWRRRGDSEEQQLPVGHLDAQHAMSCIDINQVAWDTHRLMEVNGWDAPNIPYDLFD